MQSIESYLVEFLNSDHPHRSGKVCPFMSKVLDGDRMVLLSKAYAPQLREVNKTFVEFTNREDKDVLVITYPDATLEQVKTIAKSMRMRAGCAGFMVGGFGPNEMTPSLHSQNYYPFRTESPVIVFRIMVPHDLQFFAKASIIYRAAMRVGYANRYPTASIKRTMLMKLIEYFK